MSFFKQLVQKKDIIVRKWFDAIVDTYPPETARFLRSQKDPFGNPVGHNTRQSLQAAFDLLLEEPDPVRIKTAVDPIARIRAIQDFTPAQALRFVFDLKNIVRAVLRPDEADRAMAAEMASFDRRVDEMGLLTFDVYMACREKIYELKANEMRERTFKAFARAGLVREPTNDDETSRP